MEYLHGLCVDVGENVEESKTDFDAIVDGLIGPNFHKM